MAEPDLNLLFIRFRDEGDVASIAALYDQAAPELLLVAAHFGASTIDAEDLLQSTFLAAIEAASSFDETRRVMPWLVGILINQARREQRRHQRSIDPLRLPQDHSSTPIDTAETSELAEELSTRLGSLPLHYRRILTLRVLHGLTPLEIAHALGMPPETVKTRLRRGREALRKALPAGFSAGLALLAESKTLTSVRESVLNAAANLPVAAGASPTPVAAGPNPTALVATNPDDAIRAGWWSIRSALPAFLGAASIIVAAVFLGLNAEPDPLPEAIAAARSVGKSHVSPAPLLASTRRDLAAPSTSIAPRAEDSASRISVRYENGDPAAGVWTRFEQRGAADPRLTEAFMKANDQGHISASLAPGTWKLFGDRGGKALLDLSSDVGVTLTIPAGVDILGRVQANGFPIADAGVWLSRDDRPDEGHVVTRTAADGTFRLRSVSPKRSFSIHADGYRPRPIEQVAGSVGEQVVKEIDLTDLKTDARLSGVIRDTAGSPIADAKIQIGRRLPWLDFSKQATTRLERTPPLLVVSDREGCFTVSGPPLFYGEVHVYARAPGMALAIKKVRFQEDHEHIELVLPQARAIDGVVLDKGGSPVPGARIQARDPSIGDPHFAPRFADIVSFSDEEGGYHLEGLPTSPVHITATAPGPRRATVTADHQQDRVDLTFHPLSTIHGVVVNDDGQPQAGLLVRAVPPTGHLEAAPSTTDAQGRFAIQHCEDIDHGLWVTAPKSPWRGVCDARPGVRPRSIQSDVADSGGVRVVVRRSLLPSATLSGRFVDSEGNGVAARFGLDGLRKCGLGGTTSDGQFEFHPIPPVIGGYRLYAEDANRHVAVLGNILLRPDQHLDLGDIVVRPTGAVSLDARFDGGQPIDALARIALPDGTIIDQFAVKSGVGVRDGVPVGAYVVHLSGADVPRFSTRIDVAAGETLDLAWMMNRATPVTFDLRHPKAFHVGAEAEWVDRRGVSLGRERLRWEAGEPRKLAQGFLPGDYRVRVTFDDGYVGDASFSVPSTAIEPSSSGPNSVTGPLVVVKASAPR